MTPDDVCEKHADKRVSLTLRPLPPTEEDPSPRILIEGSRTALEFLAELILAVARNGEDDGFGIGPASAGSAHFSREAALGVYIHRIDDHDRDGP